MGDIQWKHKYLTNICRLYNIVKIKNKRRVSIIFKNKNIIYLIILICLNSYASAENTNYEKIHIMNLEQLDNVYNILDNAKDIKIVNDEIYSFKESNSGKYFIVNHENTNEDILEKEYGIIESSINNNSKNIVVDNSKIRNKKGIILTIIPSIIYLSIMATYKKNIFKKEIYVW